MRNEGQTVKILPVDLLLEGRKVLVVGGGAIAARKIEHLLEAGARVTVVSRELCPDVALWKSKGRLIQCAREFKAADVAGASVVFAATNQERVNRQVLAACRQRRVLCCAVDQNWAAGGFLTPATLRHPAVTLTLSTGGQSCRRARMLKDYLSRHLDLVLSAELVVCTVGSRKPAANLGRILHRIWGLHECVILEGGARIVVLAIVSRDADVEGMVCAALAAVSGRPASAVTVVRGVDALDYTDAMGKGKAVFATAERLRAAMERGVREKWAGPMMRDWLQASLHMTAPGYTAMNAAHEGLTCAAGTSKADRYAIITRGFQGRNTVQ